jgi:hypothetical protein
VPGALGEVTADHDQLRLQSLKGWRQRLDDAVDIAAKVQVWYVGDPDHVCRAAPPAFFRLRYITARLPDLPETTFNHGVVGDAIR